MQVLVYLAGWFLVSGITGLVLGRLFRPPRSPGEPGDRLEPNLYGTRETEPRESQIFDLRQPDHSK